MVIGILAAMLILSGTISIGAVQPVLDSFLLFVVMSLLLFTVCMVPGYVRVRATCSTTPTPSRVRQATGAAIVRSHA